MRFKVLVSTGFILLLAGLVIIYMHDIKSVISVPGSIGIFLKYIAFLITGCALLLVIDLIIRLSNAPGYFKTGTVRNFAVITVFFMITILPLLGLMIGMETKLPTHENRKLAEKPSLTTTAILTLPVDFNSYFNDNFGSRKTWMSLNSCVKVKYFKIPSVPDVILGKDNWLFYKESLDDTQGVTLFSEDQLIDIKRNILRQNEWLAKRGIYYLIVIAPNKETIYPEYLPDNINIVQKQTKLDQLLACFKSTSNVHILDLRNYLLKAKPSGQLYYRTDTHWNSYGAFIGYCEIMKQLSMHLSNLKQPSISDYTVKTDSLTYSGDIAGMLSLHDLITEKAPLIAFNKDMYEDKAKLKKLVLFRDSFYNNLQTYLRANFREIIDKEFIIGKIDKFDKTILEDDPPEVVMTVCVQRQLSIILSWVGQLLPVE